MIRAWRELGFRGVVGVFQVLSEPAILAILLFAMQFTIDSLKRGNPDFVAPIPSEALARYAWFVLAIGAILGLTLITLLGARFIVLTTRNLGPPFE